MPECQRLSFQFKWSKIHTLSYTIEIGIRIPDAVLFPF